MRIISTTKDGHEVYGRIWEYIDGTNNAIFVKRWGSTLTSPYYLVRLLLIMLGDCSTIIQCTLSRKNKLFVREFNSWIWIILGSLVRLTGSREKIMLNINHNLNNVVERKFLLPLLNFLFSIVFIEPSVQMCKKYQWIEPLYFKKIPESVDEKIERIYFFLGSRQEQSILSASQLEDVIKRIPTNIDCIIVDGKSYGRLSEIDFLKAFDPKSLVTVFYSSDSYSERHSGIVLEALAKGRIVVMQDCKLGSHYQSRGFPVILIRNNIDLVKFIDSVTKIHKSQ